MFSGQCDPLFESFPTIPSAHQSPPMSFRLAGSYVYVGITTRRCLPHDSEMAAGALAVLPALRAMPKTKPPRLHSGTRVGTRRCPLPAMNRVCKMKRPPTEAANKTAPLGPRAGFESP
jgi:hypothetical protein